MGHKYRWNVEGWEPWEEPIAKKLVDRFKNRTYISKKGVGKIISLVSYKQLKTGFVQM